MSIVLRLRPGSFSDFVFPATSALLDALAAGTAYINVHTAAFPAGEIRAQLLTSSFAASAGYMESSDLVLNSAQQIPPVQSPGFGAAFVEINSALGLVCTAFF